jgi:hypothetical protein
VVAVVLLSPASPLHPALPSGRVTEGLIDGAGAIWAIVKAGLYCPYAQRVQRTRYPETRDRDKRHRCRPLFFSSVLSAQPDAMAIGPVGVIGCRRPLTSRAKGDFRQVEPSPAPDRGTHFSPPSALSLSLCPALPPQLHDLFSLPARSRPLAISLCANPSSLSPLSSLPSLLSPLSNLALPPRSPTALHRLTSPSPIPPNPPRCAGARVQLPRRGIGY